MSYNVHHDITQAHTLPAAFYRDAAAFDLVRERTFVPAWHYIGARPDLTPNEAQPFTLLADYLGEPLMLARDQEGTLRCLSNVCTHRGFLLLSERTACHELRCRYHGRRFALDGHFRSMPEFQGAAHFPTTEDNLTALPLEWLGALGFTALHPSRSFGTWLAPVLQRVGWMPFGDFHYAPAYSQVYTVKAHWALYVDNYLEGFHIPFVHPGLNDLLSYKEYSYELFGWGNLQLGIARDADTPVFDIPPGYKDSGRQVAAFYFWLFPNLMLNFYPWGLSLNVVEPVSPAETRIRFETFLWQPDRYQAANRDLMHLTELEDEAVVEGVQQGIGSRLYKHGRFSPKMEPAVHQFHRLLSEAIQ
ncbi:MAG: SRPBCC family protein [Bacteroidia bacterium]